MSQYVNFFARHDKEFVPIASYSRSTEAYKAVNAPYESLREIKEDELREIAERLRIAKNFAKTQIDRENRKIKLIFSANNSLDDKLDAVEKIQETIKEYEEESSALAAFATEFIFMANMTYDNTIYVGIEIDEPTEEDIR